MGASYSLAAYAFNQITRAKKYTNQQCLEEQERVGALSKHQMDGFRREKVEIESDDELRLRGWLLLGEKPVQRVMIMVHGYTVSSSWMLHFARPFLERGWTVLLVDQRSHGDSEGSYATYGYCEKWDLHHWINWVVQQYGDQVDIGLLGQSMGGGTVLEYASINQRVRFIIADCPYSDMQELVKYQIGKLHHLPINPLFHLLDHKLSRKAGFRMRDVSPINAVKDQADLPVMFVHGDKDDFVPTQMSVDMYNCKKGKKRLLIIPGAEHGRAYMTDRELYEREMFAFIEEALGESVAPSFTVEEYVADEAAELQG